MTSFRTLLASVTLVLICSGAASAQTVLGRQGAPRTSTPATFEKDQDLPIDAPILKIPPRPPTPPTSGTPVNSTPPPTIYGTDLKSENATLIYVIDISLSMSWDNGIYTGTDGKPQLGPRIDRAKAQLVLSIRSMPKNFKFNIFAFDCTYMQWQPTLVPADDAHKADATAWVGGLTPNGATGTGPCVSAALQLKENKLVVLLTDGAPNCGAGDELGDWPCMEAHRSQIRWANTQHAVINVFGIGATGDFRQFCMNVAADNGGSYTDIN